MRPSSHLLLVLLATLCVCASCARAQISTTRPFAPITLTDEIRKNPPLHLHYARVDLTAPSVRLRVVGGGADPDGATGPWETTLLQPSAMAQRDKLDLAVNGNFFAAKDRLGVMGMKVPYFVGNWARACGYAMSDGVVWSDQPYSPESPSLVVDNSGGVRIERLRAVPKDAVQIVSGSAQLVTNGRNTAGGSTDLSPHTAVGVDAAGKTLVLLVVDGRRPDYSAGVTVRDLADEMIHLGCTQVLQLDGGGSTTMVLHDPAANKWRVVNYPSDGHDFRIALSLERPVANVLGVQIIPGPTSKPGK